MDHRELRGAQFNTILLQKLKTIKEGEFPRLFKHDERKVVKESPVNIPREQISKFEDFNRRRLLLGERSRIDYVGTASPPTVGKKFGRKSDFDKIMANRERLRKARHGYRDDESSEYAPALDDTPKPSAVEKINEGKLKTWVDNCYETIHNSGPAKASKDLKTLVKGGTKQNEVDLFQTPSGLQESESLASLDVDVSDQQGDSSSVGSESVLRRKAKAVAGDHSTTVTSETGKRAETGGRGRPEKHLMVREGVNFVLEDFYIQDSKELRSLAYDEELYAYDKTNGKIVGSWRASAKVCEDKDDCLNVHFEGLIAEPNHSTWVMYSNGIVDRTYCPLTEFRIEQEIDPYGESRSKIVFVHKKQRKWLFDVREAAGKTETSKTYTGTYQHMQRVLTEAAHLLLVRKAIIYRYPLNFEEDDDDYECMPCEKGCFCSEAAGGCGCKFNLPLKIRKKFRLQMRALSIEGDLVRSNYRFYTPVKVRFHGVDLKVVRVRRRVEMPGNLIQTSNYFITTAGQLMAVTFNDPYPYDTNYYLQIDPKSVLDPNRVIPPERIVPLRERYMCDPELRHFYEDEVQRHISTNQAYLQQDIRILNGIKAVFQDLLNDKPHRMIDYVKDFFYEGYKFETKIGNKRGCGATRRRRKLWKKLMKKPKEDDEDANKYH